MSEFSLAVLSIAAIFCAMFCAHDADNLRRRVKDLEAELKGYRTREGKR